MDEFKLGSPHNSWTMVIGESKPVRLLDNAREDGLPEELVGVVCEVYKQRAILQDGQPILQYGVEIDEDHWIVSEESVEVL